MLSPLLPIAPRIIISPSSLSQIRVRVSSPLFPQIKLPNLHKPSDRMEISTEASPQNPSEIENGETAAVVAEKSVPEVEVDENVVQYVVLRRDLIDSWPLGSVVTQGCHASVSAIWENKDDVHTVSYCSPTKIDSMHKVTLEVKSETQLLNLAEKLKAGNVAHKVWIEQPENVPTCLATKPYPKAAVASFFKKLKLCEPPGIAPQGSSSQQGQPSPQCILPRGPPYPPPPGYFPYYPQGVSQGFYPPPPQLYQQQQQQQQQQQSRPSTRSRTRGTPPATTAAVASNKSKSQHFSVAEDTALCNSWIKVSDDVVTTNQHGQCYWIRIYKEFKSQMPGTIRTFDSLKSRWTTIKRTIKAFTDILQQVEDGATLNDRVNAAQAAYLAKYSTAFGLEHCYDLVKDHPKWAKQFASGKGDSEMTLADPDSNNTPEAKTSGKRKRKLAVVVEEPPQEDEISNEDNISRDTDIHVRMMEIEAKNKATEAKLKRNKILVRSEEMKIMTTDTLLFDEELKRLWEMRQDRIKARWAVGNYDGSDGEGQ